MLGSGRLRTHWRKPASSDGEHGNQLWSPADWPWVIGSPRRILAVVSGATLPCKGTLRLRGATGAYHAGADGLALHQAYAGKVWSCAGPAGRCACAVHAPLSVDHRSAAWYPAEADTLSVSLCGFPERGGYGRSFTRCT
ncbi:MAG: hypothetical protein GFH27_549309n3 [Chloroflexi bacterium AL-W]|nr:hypothetical protein [Chloroflexi bacterium AL-N1]NOK69706.1 hypothetical protein [Chloroflexi bacterium AL-N10]NOK73690.1 hypothetical protein [Chloroflexi bacterium AL-N5]NOK83876.1 hypothetical protein [Chloroflexi bacterium AL-W]NOK88021.1 hypothetical protein [Chloroflexi bacterium AL-N15]